MSGKENKSSIPVREYLDTLTVKHDSEFKYNENPSIMKIFVEGTDKLKAKFLI